ncbi:hypothetical protein DLAC_08555 [Tieghemostelium lacteum]|uniref:Uncharacterized protein n=1 Tax=Tieghemostelium lacteum TaxID=361077 RepID=A0A151Z7N9_TIELA|nr:hypothetical protein DLAC_08555 [Tieghemostelium lacteum]|eukprot:KYQ89983.1 hypothetical protein DLAC_08555 [Tieghemostelium lacteum]
MFGRSARLIVNGIHQYKTLSNSQSILNNVQLNSNGQIRGIFSSNMIKLGGGGGHGHDHLKPILDKNLNINEAEEDLLSTSYNFKFQNLVICETEQQYQEAVSKFEKAVKEHPEYYKDEVDIDIDYEKILEMDAKSKNIHAINADHHDHDHHDHHDLHKGHDHHDHEHHDHDHHDHDHEHHDHEHEHIDPDEVEETEPRGYFLNQTPHSKFPINVPFLLTVLAIPAIYAFYLISKGDGTRYEEFRQKYFESHPEVKDKYEDLTKKNYPLSH